MGSGAGGRDGHHGTLHLYGRAGRGVVPRCSTNVLTPCCCWAQRGTGMTKHVHGMSPGKMFWNMMSCQTSSFKIKIKLKNKTSTITLNHPLMTSSCFLNSSTTVKTRRSSLRKVQFCQLWKAILSDTCQRFYSWTCHHLFLLCTQAPGLNGFARTAGEGCKDFWGAASHSGAGKIWKTLL